MKSKQILGQRKSINLEQKTGDIFQEYSSLREISTFVNTNKTVYTNLKLNPMNFHHSSSLLLVNLNDIILFHLESLGGLVIIDPSSIEQETEAGLWDSHPLAVRLLEFAHLCSL